MSSSLVVADRQVPVVPAQLPPGGIPPGQEAGQEALVPDILREARAEYDAAVQAAANEEAQGAAQPRAQTQTAGTTQPQPDISHKSAMIPLQRFQQVYAQGRQLAQELEKSKHDLAYWKGVAEAHAAMAQGRANPGATPTGANAPPNPEPSIKDLIADQQAQLIAAAKKFDDGELTMEAWATVQVQTGNEIARLRDMEAQARSPAPTHQVGVADELVMKRFVAELEAAHPWSAALPRNELQVLAQMAMAEAQAQGNPIEQSPAGTMRLQKRVAELSDWFGPTWHPEMIGTNPNNTTTPTVAIQTQPTQVTQPTVPPQQPRAQVMPKIDLAMRHPPQIAGVGSAAPPQGELTDSQIEAMSHDDWAALPDAVRTRLRNR